MQDFRASTRMVLLICSPWSESLGGQGWLVNVANETCECSVKEIVGLTGTIACETGYFEIS
jgi:hypothetical protein